MLNQSSAVMHIQNLKTPANSKHRHIPLNRLIDELKFHLVALVVRLIRLERETPTRPEPMPHGAAFAAPG
jgi:hypothetical protein